MPAAERTRAATTPSAVPAELTGWGGGPAAPVTLIQPADVAALVSAVRADVGPARPAIARGAGRSYGDAAQLRNGQVIVTTALRGYELDVATGVLRAEAGVTIAELLPVLVPRGWILPVLPGTQHVTVGGMIASDIHGKNHGTVGSVGAHVLRIRLLTSGGDVLELEPGQPDFEATIGGMGLTGVIVSAEIQLRRVAGPLISVDTDRAGTLDEILAALEAPGGEHRVAWLDLLAGRGRIRGVVTRASYADAAASASTGGDGARTARPDVAVRATVPGWWPGWLPRTGVRAFNELRFRLSPVRQRDHLEPIARHMFPLDVLGAWPRLYGRRGFVQYQLVVPPGSEATLTDVLRTLERHRVPSFLAVLKDFGDAGAAPLSFPIRGWTLALDLPRAASELVPALDRCDELVAEAGGRVYLSKDSRLRADLLGAMYPRLGEWRERRDALDEAGRWRSDLAIRLGLV